MLPLDFGSVPPTSETETSSKHVLAVVSQGFIKFPNMGDMKTPDFDDLLAAFDIPDTTSLDAKEAIQSTSDESEGHLKSTGMCIDENLPLSHTVPASDVPVVSVIVKNTSRQESFESDKEGNHLGSGLLQNGFRGSDMPCDPHNIGHNYGKFDSTFINGDSSRSYVDKIEPHKTEPLPTFSQFSPISSPEPDDSVKDNGIANKQNKAESPYFPHPPLYVPPETCSLDTSQKPLEPELSMFDQYCKKEQKTDIQSPPKSTLETKTVEQDRTMDKMEELNKDPIKANSFLNSALPFSDLQNNSTEESKSVLADMNTSSSVPPRQRIKPSHSKLSSCVAALVALQAKKVADISKEEQPSIAKEVPVPLKEAIKGSPKMPKSPKSPRSPLEVVKRINKQPESPMSICSDTSSKGSPSVGAGSPPAIPKVRIKTIKTSSGEIKRTVTRILPDMEADELEKSPEEFCADNITYEEPEEKPLTLGLESTTEIEQTKTPTKSSAPTSASLVSSVVDVKTENIANKNISVASSPLQNPGSGTVKVNVAQLQNKKQQQQTVSKSVSNLTNHLPKAVHLANLNLVPHSVAASVAAKSSVQRRNQPQPTQMSVPLVHQVKKVAPVIVEAFNKLLNSANPVPRYRPDLDPPAESNIRVPSSGYCCLECGDSFALEKSLTQHYNRRSVHIEVLCTQCSKVLLFYNKCSLLGHAREHKSNGFIMQCSQLLMKPISADKMFASSASATSLTLATHSSTLTASSQVSISRASTSISSGTGSSSNVQPAMPLYAEPSRLSRYGPKCLECNKQVQDYCSLAGHFQRTVEENDGLTCQICQMTLPNKCSYSAHQRIHTHKSPYCCPECGTVCRSAYFQTHVKENCLHYTRKVGFRCIHCGVVCVSLGMLKLHLQDKHCEVFHKCSFCPMAFKSADSTTAHITAHHPTAPHKIAQLIYKCSCETVFNRKKLLHEHFFQNTNKLLGCVFKCPICDLVYMQKPLLMQHVKSVHGIPKIPEDPTIPRQKPAAASSNQASASSIPLPTVAVAPVEPAANGTLHLASAAKKNTSSEQKAQEVKSRLKTAGWTCAECTEWIPTRETYIFHMKKSHGKSLKRYPCRQCSKSFNSPNTLRKHVRNNHDTSKKIYTCSYCTDEKQVFSKTSMLENHINLMHGIKHSELTHTSEPENPVEKVAAEAPKRTAAEALVKAESTDESDASLVKKQKTSYKCAKCGYSTDTSIEFQEHIPQHKTDNSTFQCLHCGLCYTSQISLNRHLFIVHKMKEEEEEEERGLEKQDKKHDHSGEASIKTEEESLWECKECKQTFQSKEAHESHSRTHGTSSACTKHSRESE
ncbi:zinc finger protein 592 isoform X2 [Microcaecilia unicolor]|uniref:Zinc finger protein 592 isoform X2 n=1 Tax=Microcaecilia unicolor TaxID=1415580 RepID=A0A6P7WXT7_9AMPH|nr:zinc finger protein 592 isoform X2 [Microcaecilia unicolor]